MPCNAHMVQEKRLRQQLSVKLSMAKFLQDALEETAVQIKGKQGSTLKEFATFIEEVSCLAGVDVRVSVLVWCLVQMFRQGGGLSVVTCSAGSM